MKITFILPGLSRFPVGGYKVVYEYANYFARQGHQVSIIHVEQVPDGYVKMRVHLKNVAIRFKLMGKNSITWFQFDQSIRLKFVPDFSSKKVPDADVVIATAWHTARFVAHLPKEKGRKYYFIQGYESHEKDKNLENDSWKLPLNKIVVASWLKKVGDKLGVQTDIVKNFINHREFFSTNSVDRSPGISMLVHNLSLKGSVEGIRVLKRVYEKYPKVKVILFGLPDKPDNLPKAWSYIQNASTEQLREQVYSQTTIYLFPSHQEGWGLTATEAMACGNALVSTDNGGIRDFGFEQRNAMVVKVRDEQGMFAAICNLLDNTEKMKRFQLESIKISSALTIENSGDKFLKILSNS